MDQIIDIQIEKMSFGGKGIGYYNGKVVFASDTLPGDVARVHIYRQKKSFAEASLVELIEPSKQRQLSPCAYSSSCGGCPWIQARYEDQLTWKLSFINSALSKIGKLNHTKAQHIIASKDRLHYRNRVKLKAHISSQGVLSLGYFAKSSHELISIQSCKIADPLIDKAIGWLAGKQLKNKYPFQVELELQVIQPEEPKLIANILSGTKRPKLEDQKALIELIHACPDIVWVSALGVIEPKLFIYDHQDGIEFFTSSGQFQQVNLTANHSLRSYIKDLITKIKPQKVLDLYCGSGNLSLLSSLVGSSIIGIELNQESIKTAQFTLTSNRITGAEYICAKAEHIDRILKEKGPFDFILIDPPRAGLKDAIYSLMALKASHICYVSCDPNTLARDLNLLSEDYEVEEVTGMDFFPQTYHVETIAILSRKAMRPR